MVGEMGKRKNIFRKISKSAKKAVKSVSRAAKSVVPKPLVKAQKNLQKKVAKTKILRGSKFNKLALLAFGPAAPIAKTLRDAAMGKKSSILKGNIKIPKALKKIPVIKNLPGVNRGYLNVKTLANPKMLAYVPTKALAQEFKKKKPRPPTQVAAQAVAQGAAQVANANGVSASQVIEQPQQEENVEMAAQQNLDAQQAEVEEKLRMLEEEIAIRQAELGSMTGGLPDQSVSLEMKYNAEREAHNKELAAKGLRGPMFPPFNQWVQYQPESLAESKEEILEDQAYGVQQAMYDLDMDASEENIEDASGEMEDQWMEEQEGELESAEAARDYLQSELEAIQNAREILWNNQEEGGGFMGVLNSLRGL